MKQRFSLFKLRLIGFGVVALTLVAGPIPQAKALGGVCKNTELEFHNRTNGNITIPESGHRVKNPGGFEGFNQLTLGSSKVNLVPSGLWSDTIKLNIKCVDDAEFQIKWSDDNGDHTSIFTKVNIEDQNAHFDLR